MEGLMDNKRTNIGTKMLLSAKEAQVMHIGYGIIRFPAMS
jgi:hypothetical protein